MSTAAGLCPSPCAMPAIAEPRAPFFGATDDRRHLPVYSAYDTLCARDGATPMIFSHPLAVCRSTEDGRLKMSNNAAARAIRPLALGRRNWTYSAIVR